jgi:methyl-accepting chemotaxis protein
MPSPKSATRRSAVSLVEPAPPYVSPSMEVLQTLELQNTLSGLEARLDSMEIDVARMTGSREDDARRAAGEMAVMKARVEDALSAFSGTAGEIQELLRSLEKRLDQSIPGDASGDARAEVSAAVDGVMAGVGDALGTLAGDVRRQIDGLAARVEQIQESMLQIAEHAGGVTSLAERLSDVERAVGGLLDTRARQG